MITCPSCSKGFNSRYQFCPNCGYKLTASDKDRILSDKQPLIERGISLAIVNIIVLISWLIIGILLFFVLNNIVLMTIISRSLLCVQLAMTIINFVTDINLLNHRFIVSLKEYGSKLFLINLLIFIFNCVSIFIFIKLKLLF